MFKKIALSLTSGAAISLCLADPAIKETKLLMQSSEQKAGNIGTVTVDGVMGGLSTGKLAMTENGLMSFSGDLSLKNNGGFSRWNLSQKKYDFSAWKGIQLKVKGDGRAYNFRLTTDERFRGRSPISFQGLFTTKKNEWVTLQVPFEKLKASWRGRPLKTPFDASNVESFGIMLADKTEGSFTLLVESISIYR